MRRYQRSSNAGALPFTYPNHRNYTVMGAHHEGVLPVAVGPGPPCTTYPQLPKEWPAIKVLAESECVEVVVGRAQIGQTVDLLRRRQEPGSSGGGPRRGEDLWRARAVRVSGGVDRIERHRSRCRALARLVDAQSIQPGVESPFIPEEPQIFAIVAPNVLCGRGTTETCERVCGWQSFRVAADTSQLAKSA